MSRSVVKTTFNVQRFSLHDGPGMWDPIFLKGCPLRCKWCANPGSQYAEPELSCRLSECIGRRACTTACPTRAVAVAAGGRIQMDRVACRGCFTCARAYYPGALSRIDEALDARILVKRVTVQHMSWHAGNGVTLSGGKPLAQPDFAAKLLQRFREGGVETALETCGYMPFEAFQKAVPFCQLIFFDLKYMVPGVHRRYIGVDNRRILDNLMVLSRELPDSPLRVHAPLIPGVNDDREQLSGIVQFPWKLLSLADYELLPYHNWGEGKHRRLGRNYPLAGLESPDRGAVEYLSDKLRAELGLRPGQE